MTNDCTDLVAATPELACVPGTTTPYVLSFSKGLYGVPESKVLSYARKANEIDSPEDLGKLLATKAPDKWLPYCHPDTITRIEGEEGNCCYTTFEVKNGEGPAEHCHLHLISATIAHKNFPIKAEELKDSLPHDKPKQAKRWAALSWRRETDLPVKAQINPEVNRWPALTEAQKSCAKPPESKKRPKGSASDKRAREENELRVKRAAHIKDEAFISVGPKGTYAINEVAGVVHVVQYHQEGGDVRVASEAEPAEAEEDETES
jgi:hypothetical protein